MFALLLCEMSGVGKEVHVPAVVVGETSRDLPSEPCAVMFVLALGLTLEAVSTIRTIGRRRREGSKACWRVNCPMFRVLISSSVLKLVQ